MTRNSIESLKIEWRKKYQGEPLVVETKNIDGFEVRFNPLRAQYMTSTQHGGIDTDVFCHKWDRIVENEMIGEISLPNFSWIITTNTSPIEEFHSLLICSEHQAQEISLPCLEDLVAFSQTYPDISIGFNGWKAGASQQHLHAQLFFSALPISQWEVDATSGLVRNYPGLCFTFSDTKTAFDHISKIREENAPYNVLISNEKIYIIPRKNEFDTYNVKRGFDSVFGKVPVLSQENYDQVSSEEIRSILASLTFQLLILQGESFTA